LKRFSYCTLQNNFLKHFVTSTVWNNHKLKNQGINNYQLHQSLDANLLEDMFIELIREAAICPPSDTYINLRDLDTVDISSQINIIELYNRAIVSPSNTVKSFGKVLLLLYFYCGITKNVTNSSNVVVLNNTLSEFVKIFGLESLKSIRPENISRTPAYNNLCATLVSCYDRFLESDQQSAEVTLSFTPEIKTENIDDDDDDVILKNI